MADPQLTRRVLPPIDGGEQWHRDITDELNALPPTSNFSVATPESNVTSAPGTIGVNIGATGPSLWVKESGSGTTGWSSLATAQTEAVASENSAAIADALIFRPCFAHIGVDDGSTAQTGIGETALKVTGFTSNGGSFTCTPDATNDQLIAGSTGTYSCMAFLSFSGTANIQFEFHMRRNGTRIGPGFHRKIGAGGDVGAGSMSNIKFFDEGDTLDAAVQVTTGGGAGKSITLADAQLYMQRIL